MPNPNVKNFSKGRCRIEVKFNSADSEPVQMMIYEDIGDDPFTGESGLTAQAFREALADVPKGRALDLRINSAGGSVHEGLAIKTAIDEWPGRKTASIDGMAASVASWLPLSCDEIRAPAHAQMFIHDAWGAVIGNAEDMRSQALELDKTSNQIAQMYAAKTGKSVTECRDLMRTGTLMTGEEALQLGLIDRITIGEPVSNFTESQIRNMKSKIAALNSLTSKNIMERTEMELLATNLGISFNKETTDAALLALIKNFKPVAPKKNGHGAGCNCKDCNKKNKKKASGDGSDGEDGDDDAGMNAPEPSAESPDADADDGAPGTEGTLFKAATANKKVLAQMKNFLQTQRTTAIQSRLDKFVEDQRISGNDVPAWLNLAVAAEDDKGNNPILMQLEKLTPLNAGRQALSIEIGDDASLEKIPQLDKYIKNLMNVQQFFSRNGTAYENLADRMKIAENSKEVSRVINKLKKFDKDGNMVGPLRDAYDKWVSSPRNANTMSTGLLRQVILSETMRAFRRQFTSLSYFAHNFGNVPLEGTDFVDVPYYPLSTTASTEFTYSSGYVISPTATTSAKSIFVGGIGNGVASGGSGRKYQPLQFQAYEIRRYPWLDIQKLSVLAGEQLAIDVRADIIGTQINATNFGNAVWTGQSGGFDHNVLGNVLMLAAIQNYWPLKGRNLVLAPSYFTNLAVDPGLYPYLYSGSTEILNEGIIKNKYGFEEILHDPLLPVANFIQGGSGSNLGGTDPNLAGYMCWPSAVLIATAPIMPPPGVLKKLVAFEQITDDQTNLTFTYQFWGNESANVDNEVIECTYGSGLGELKALFRLTTTGN